MLKKALLVILFVFLLGTVSYAETDNMKRIFISEAFHVSKHMDGQALFLFSEGSILRFSGNMILVGSRVNVAEGAEGIIICVVSDVTLPENSAAEVYSIGAYSLRAFFSVLSVGFSLLYTAVRKSFFEQGSVVLPREPLRTVTSGILFYFFMLALMIVFMVSVVGFPIAALFLVLLVIFISFGQTALGVMFGGFFADKLHVDLGTYQSVFIGSVFIELLKYIPYFEWGMYLVILPILSLGVLANTVINGFAKKVFYPTRYETDAQATELESEQKLKRRARIRGIISQNGRYSNLTK